MDIISNSNLGLGLKFNPKPKIYMHAYMINPNDQNNKKINAWTTNYYIDKLIESLKMSVDSKKKAIKDLKQMIDQKDVEEQVGEVFVKFCSRNSCSMETCEEYYRLLIKTGEIQKEWNLTQL